MQPFRVVLPVTTESFIRMLEWLDETGINQIDFEHCFKNALELKMPLAELYRYARFEYYHVFDFQFEKDAILFSLRWVS